MPEMTLHPLGIGLALLFLSLMLALFRWMFAVPPQLPVEVITARAATAHLQRVLVPLIDSPASQHAVELACRLAGDNKAEIILAYVVAVPLSLSLDAPLPDVEKKARHALENGSLMVQQHKLKSETRIVRHRSASEGILALAREVDADVIVMGTGLPQRRNFAELGPTATDVLRRAPCEVVLAKAPLAA